MTPENPCLAVELARREYVYVMSPRDYEISGCKCGNNDCQWSEYLGRLWCPICKIDFVPEHAGIFNGPICVEVCKLIGITFDSFDLTTQERVAFESPTWPLSPQNPKAKNREKQE